MPSYVPPHRKTAQDSNANGQASTSQFNLRRPANSQPEPEDTNLQKQRWKALTRGIVAAVNKTSKSTVADRAVDLIRFNIQRGRGIFCRAIMRSQEANPDMSDLFAALASVINRQFPSVGLLLLKRLLIQWRRYYGRKYGEGAKNECRFIAQLYVFGVCEDKVVLELFIALLCQDPIGDLEIDIAATLFRECYRVLESRNPKAFHEILVPLRDMLQADPKMLSKRSESVVEALLESIKNWQKSKFDVSYIDPSLLPIMEANAESDIAPHSLSLDDPSVGGDGNGFGDPEGKLDVFQYDPNFADTENEYNEMKQAILGPLADSPPMEDEVEDGIGDWEEDETDGAAAAAAAYYTDLTNNTGTTKKLETPSATNASSAPNSSHFASKTISASAAISDENLRNMFSPDAQSPFSQDDDRKIRSNIVTAIQSSMGSDESAHKLLKGKVAGSEPLICSLITDACAQEPIYRKSFALLADRLCRAAPAMVYFWSLLFRYRYLTAEKLDDSQLDVNARIFAHLLGTDAIPWRCLEVVDISTSDVAQRIFVGKIISTIVSEYLNAQKVQERFRAPDLASRLRGLFPIGDVEKVSQAILFFRGIGGVDALKTDMELWYNKNRKRQREE